MRRERQAAMLRHPSARHKAPEELIWQPQPYLMWILVVLLAALVLL